MRAVRMYTVTYRHALQAAACRCIPIPDIDRGPSGAGQGPVLPGAAVCCPPDGASIRQYILFIFPAASHPHRMAAHKQIYFDLSAKGFVTRVCLRAAGVPFVGFARA